MKINYYKLAPTWLFNSAGETELFNTQDKVDQAWKDGWFGPKSLTVDSPLLSTLAFETKRELIDAVNEDIRYRGLKLRLRETFDVLKDTVRFFEEEAGVKIE